MKQGTVVTRPFNGYVTTFDIVAIKHPTSDKWILVNVDSVQQNGKVVSLSWNEGKEGTDRNIADVYELKVSETNAIQEYPLLGSQWESCLYLVDSGKVVNFLVPSIDNKMRAVVDSES